MTSSADTQNITQTYQRSFPLSDLANALIQFQQAVPTIHDNDKSFYGSFTNLPGILSTIGPALRNNGLAVSQLPEEINGQPGLRTTLMHASGQQISSVTPLIMNEGQNGTQEWGKAMTYARRYALQAVLGLCVGIEDNDADIEPTDSSVQSNNDKTTAKHKRQPVVAIDNAKKAKEWKDYIQTLGKDTDWSAAEVHIRQDKDFNQSQIKVLMQALSDAKARAAKSSKVKP